MISVDVKMRRIHNVLVKVHSSPLVLYEHLSTFPMANNNQAKIAASFPEKDGYS